MLIRTHPGGRRIRFHRVGGGQAPCCAAARCARDCRLEREHPGRPRARASIGVLRAPRDFATAVVALGTPAFTRFLAASGPFNLIFNFAALKHVRSERDPFSLMRMIETNALAVEDLMHQASRWCSRLFSVSTDKAVFPTSLMGATKRWMERILAQQTDAICMSARFANVAFSHGSLLNAILDRVNLRQPIGAPDNVRRYFISHTEAAQLCLLAAFLGNGSEIFVPVLDPTRNCFRLMKQRAAS